MSPFPAVDPIPLPAPVLLFKGLHILTLALHFISVEMLLGGLLVATWLNLRGSIGSRDEKALLRLNAAAALSRRLPVVMTYVINLGVPPLLFAQVLYGRALYTSSVLIGVYWIAVVFLLMGCYWLIYRFAAGAEGGRSVWWQGLLACVLAGCIARILSTNMTLMLRPEVWGQMYAASAHGTHLPPHDPTLHPRWMFMVAGGFWVTGIWMVWLAGRQVFDEAVRKYLSATGGRMMAVMVLVQVFLASLVLRAQPQVVRDALAADQLAHYAGIACILAAVLVLLFGLWVAFTSPTGKGAGWVGAALLLVTMLSVTTYRDALRDLTLLGKGYDVWQRAVVTNWGVVVLFLLLFVGGLITVGWLVSVMMRAKRVSEKVM